MKPESGKDAILTYCNKPGVDMSDRPEFYSGRGVNYGDLGPKHLVAIFEGLECDFGPEVAVKFCEMLEELENLSATSFLNQFYLFFARGFSWPKGRVEESGIDLGPDGPSREAIGLATIMGALFGRDDNSPDQIKAQSTEMKREFFRSVGYKPKKMEAESHPYR